MFGVMVERRGMAGSGFFVREGELAEDALLETLAEVAHAPKLLLCGTAFAFVHWLEALEQRGLRLSLPAGTRIMETGGFKGRARELPREQLHGWLRDRLGVPVERIVNQYGMTELGSQFYDSVLLEPARPRRKLAPAWTRVRVVDPASEREVPEGAVGALRIVDLANTGSVLAVATADLARRCPDGFEVLGREAGAEARGCSIAADEMLAGA
jgi:hypothetical protein